MLQILALSALLLLINWWLFRARATRAQRQAHQPHPPVAPVSEQRPQALPETPAAATTDDTVPAPAFVTRAFPVIGFVPPLRDHAGALELELQQLEGVAMAYVSPVTALAYLDYLPDQVTEEQLVQCIERAGYGVGAATQRFDWRRAPAPAGTARLQCSGPVAGAIPQPGQQPVAAAN